MSKYQFTFLTSDPSASNQNAPDKAAAALAEKWAQEKLSFHKIITGPDSDINHTVSSIREHIPAEVEKSPLWQLKPPADNDWQLYLHSGEALQSLFEQPPENYLILTHANIIHSIISAIFGGSPRPKQTYANLYLKHNSYLVLEFDTEDLRWHIAKLSQPESPHALRFQHPAYQFTFIRHGESLGNVKRVFQGQKEFPLSDNGRQQANQLAAQLAEHDIVYDKIFSSPQERALDTAKIISKKSGVEVTPLNIWKEIDNGGFAGLTRQELVEKYPDHDPRFHPFLPLGETGESWLQLYLRGGRALNKLLDYPAGKYLVVAHGAILNAAVSSIFGIAPQPGRLTPVFHFENTGGANISYHPQTQSWQFISLSPRIQL